MVHKSSPFKQPRKQLEAELAKTQTLLKQEILLRKGLETKLSNMGERECLVRRMIELVSQTFNIERIVRGIADEVGIFFQVNRCVVSRYEEVEGELRIRVSGQYRSCEEVLYIDPADLPIRTAGQLDQCAHWTEGSMVLVDRCSLRADYPALIWYFDKYQIQSLLGVEVLYRGMPLGFISLHQSHRREWSREALDLMKYVATHLGVAFYQTQLYEEEQNAKEVAKSINQRKDMFLANMSHELRTPLNAIIGFSQMLEELMVGELNEKQQKYVHNIVISGRHLLDMVNNILDIAKIESGKTELILQSIQLDTLLIELENIFQEMADQKNISIRHSIDNGLNQIKADPSRLRQILFNLISNAIKFNRPDGQVWISFHKSPDSHWVIAEIKDTGNGIPKEAIPKLFNEFYRVENTLPNAKEGTGLGLVVTKKLIEHHGGSISVESEEGRGSTFRFNLPL